MNILLIGGTGFISRHVVSQLRDAGHRLTIFHRGNSSVPEEEGEILGDRNHLPEFKDLFRQKKFDLVIDMVLSSARQAQALVETFRGLVSRVVVASSMDVYRAWGVFYGLEPGGLQAMPVNEESDLRTRQISY